MSSQEIAIRMQDLSPGYAEIMVIGNVLFKSGYFKDVRDQAQAVAKILYGRELGFSPIVSMSGIHIIEGKPALSSNLLAALIKRSGRYDYRVVKMDDTECTLMFREKIDNIWEDLGVASFTIEDAKRAGVVRQGSGWTRFPKSMLFARAISLGERTYCPDVSSCALYVPEELGATVNESGEVTELPAQTNGGNGYAKAKPVTYTTEETLIDPPKEIAGPVHLGSTESKGLINSVKASETVGGQIAGSEAHVASGEAVGSVEASSASTAPAVEYISIGQQKNIHAEFRKAVRKDYAGDKDFAFYDQLDKMGFRDKDKVPSAAMIPASRWFEVKEVMLKKAASL